MSSQEFINFDTLKVQFDTYMDSEKDLLRLLHEVVELSDMMQQNEHRQFIQLIVPELMKILKDKEPSFYDNTRHKIRRYSLEILHMIPFNDNFTPLNSQLTDIYLDVMQLDNEENAELSIKAIIEMQKYYKTLCDVLDGKYEKFLRFFTELISNFPRKINQIMDGRDDLLVKSSVDPSCPPIRKSIESLKSIPHCCHYLLLLSQMFDDSPKKMIQTLIPKIIESIKDFPDEMLSKVQNMTLYIEYLEILKNILSFITFLLKRNFTELVIDNIEYVLQVQIRILKNTPPSAIILRRDILHMIKFEITETMNLQKQDQVQGNHRALLFQKNRASYQRNIDDLLNLSIISGQGKLSKELSYYTNTLIFSFVQYIKEDMTLDQLKKSMLLIIKNILDPMVTLSLKNTLIFILYRLDEEITNTKNYRNHSLQFEVLESLVLLCKELMHQFKAVVDEITVLKNDQSALKSNIKWMNDIEQKNLPLHDLFKLEDGLTYDPLLSQSQLGMNPQSQNDQQQGDPIEQQKDVCIKIAKNLVSCVDTVLNYIQDIKGQKSNTPQELKQLRKFLIYGSHIIQSLFELAPTEKDKLIEILRKFANIFQKMKPLQFRDLFFSVQDEFFGYVLEIKATKGDTGVVLFADYLMTFQASPQNINQNNQSIHYAQDDQTAYFLEIFFDYIVRKMQIIGRQSEPKDLNLSQNKQDKVLAAICLPDMQDALQKLILLIGEKALSRNSDLRMKHLFFTVFIFCIKYTRANEIVPYYFQIIRNLFKDLCNFNDNTNFVKEFIPMIQGLLETFLQAKEEASFIRETNEICYTAPAKLKNLIEYLPVISKPLIDSMKSTQIELIESGINTIQLWVSALASYPEILDPVIAQILPDLNSMLYRILYLLPNYTFKLLGKLGAKSRLYYEDKEFKSKNYPEDGLKIDLEDKFSNQKVVLGIDSAIDVVLLKIFDNYQKYNQSKLLEAYKLVKSSFLCFIEPDVDLDYLVASIINAPNKNNELLTAYAYNSTKFFTSKKPQIKVSSLGKGSESHAFEKILKCLLIACSLPKNNPETTLVNQKVKRFFKWVTQYFTMIYICKNGKLKHNLINEISSLVFIENICDFLYYNMLQSVQKTQSQRSYFKGSIIAIKTMIRMVNKIYETEGDRIGDIYDKLEFIQILIKKICHLAYGSDLPKKVAANIALQLIIKELPYQTVRMNTNVLLDALFHILNTNSESLVYQVEKECRNTLNLLFEKIHIFEERFAQSIDEKDQEFYSYVVDKIMQNLISPKKSARQVSMTYLELISKSTNQTIKEIMQRVQCSYPIQQLVNEQAITIFVTWEKYFITYEIEKKAKYIFTLFKGGYTSILNLLSYLDLFIFVLKHKVVSPVAKEHIYLAICEQLIKILEDESERYESKIENVQNYYLDQMISATSRNAQKYMKLEKSYIQQNKIYDPYSHTVHPHHFLSKQHFEVEEQAKKDKLKQECEAVQFSYKLLDLFENSPLPFDTLKAEAKADMVIDDINKWKDDTLKRVNSFIHKLFASGIRVSDIGHDYINHFYELFPNFRLHTELICRALTLLIDISVEDHMHTFFKLRQVAYFDQLLTQPKHGSSFADPHNLVNNQSQSSQQQPPQQPNVSTEQVILPHMKTKVDFYAMEIKSKIIALYFKYFQREEANIYKTAKKCLTKQLRKESNQQEALPNQILKECVRPALNILSQRMSCPSHYKHLTRLIYVLHACFNDQLGKHLLKTCEQMKKQILDSYVFPPQNPQANPAASEASSLNEPNPQPDAQPKFSLDYERLLYQYNTKIEHLEIANYIIQILHLLPIQRDFFQNFLIFIPHFEHQIAVELESKFEESLQKILDTYNMPLVGLNYETLTKPIRIKLGSLRSDFKIGLSRFFNKNTLDAISLLQYPKDMPQDMLRPVLLEILNEKGSYCLRERMARENEILRVMLSKSMMNPDEANKIDFDLGITICSILVKFIPNFLLQTQNHYIVDELILKWEKLNTHNVENIRSQNLIQLRKAYSNIQKCLLSYCKSNKADIKVLFDLIKGYSYQSLIDLTPTKVFFCNEVPDKFSMEQKKALLNAALGKLTSQSISFEQKYMIFELAFMPSIIKACENQQEFLSLVSKDLMVYFMESFFGLQLVQLRNGGSQNMIAMQVIKKRLENSYQVSHESFQIEVIKVVHLILLHLPTFIDFLNVCPASDCKAVNHFLNQCAKKSSNSELKEQAFYTLSFMYLRIIEQQWESDQVAAPLIEMASQGAEQILMLVLQHSSSLQNRALVHKAFANIIKLSQDKRIGSFLREGQLDVSLYLRRALNFEGRHTQSLMYLCSFILGHEETFYQSSQSFQNKLYKVIYRFAQQYQPNIAQRQLAVELAAVLVEWSKKKLKERPPEGMSEEDHQNRYMNMNSNILYQLIRTSIMLNCSNDPMKDKLEVSAHCLKQIRNIIIIHNNLKIQFPFFNRLLQSDNEDKENIQLIRMILLNVSYILIKHQSQSLDFKNFFMDYICGANSRNFKCILFSTKIITDIVTVKNIESHQHIINKLRELLNEDLKKCLSEDIEKLAINVAKVEENYVNQGRAQVLAFQDQAKLIYNAIPHFSIRLIHNIEKRKEEEEKGDGSNDVEYFQIKDFKFYKDLATAIFTIVGYFRKNLVLDQTEIGNSRFRYKNTVQFQPTNSQTIYTQPELVTLNNDIVELKVEEPNYDLFNKESIMMGILILVKKMKQFPQEEAIQILEVLQYIFSGIFKFNLNEYIIEWLRKIVNLVITDDQSDCSKLLLEQKSGFVLKMMMRISDLIDQKRETPSTIELINNIFDQCVTFLEGQHSIWPEHLNKLFERVFFLSKGKNVYLKQRLFKVFEKFNGTNLFKKIQFFLHKHSLEDIDKNQLAQGLSQFLDFTLYNFKTHAPLKKTALSSRLFPLTNLCVEFDQSLFLDDRNAAVERDRICDCLAAFKSKTQKYKQLQIKELMNPLSDIISINPSHSTDKLLSDKIFIKVFWQYWNILSREEQQYLGESINKFFTKTIPQISGSEGLRKYSFAKTFLEAVSAISPQIRIEPEVLQHLGKQLNLWHVSIPILENHLVLYPHNERYFFALNELYNKLIEEDYIAGLRRSVTDCPETRTIISYGQHNMWEEINQMFSNYIDYYAEQEGLYAFMDRDQGFTGKYSSQIPFQFIVQLNRQQAQEHPNAQMNQDNYFDKQEYREQISADKFPKQGPNRQVKELDLRIWETLFIESLKILNSWDQYRDIAHTLSNQEMMIEYYWYKKEWARLAEVEVILRKSESIKYQLYYIYLTIQQQKINQFDEIFKQVIQLAYKEWDQYLPNYVDNIQFQNLIMFQLVMESSEGGRNMIKEAKNLRNKQRLAEIKTAINIWRERIPHTCENITMWKDILENRNFIYEQISNIISPKNPIIPPNTPQEQIDQIQASETLKQNFANELLDITWNYVKLANISRKHGLPNLAFYYVQQAKAQLGSQNDCLKYERFKVDYEVLKLHIQYNTINMEQIVVDAEKLLDDNRYNPYEPWQKGEFSRVLGEYYLSSGHIAKARDMLTKSVGFNKKEAKTWISYAKLNELIFNRLGDEKSYQNALKGYMCGTVLNLHKSKLILPSILKLMKRKEHANNTRIQQWIKANLEQMPTWVWIFWTPQLINFLYSSSPLEQYIGKVILFKLSKIYPQAVYYALKSKNQYQGKDNSSIIVELIKYIKYENSLQIHAIEQIGKEFHENIKMSPEEELQILLTKMLNIFQFLENSKEEADKMQGVLNQIYIMFFREDNIRRSKLLKKLQFHFYNDFVNPETKEKGFLEQIERLKNFKDFLHKKLSLTILHANLEEMSQYLVNFNYKGIELPGQYSTVDQEPLPEHTVFIQKFEPMIYRSGITSKKIAIKGSNSKIYAFVMTGAQHSNDYIKFCSEERVVQMKVIMNSLFQRHKETLRRGIKFYTPIKVIMNQNKLCQDDLPFANMQEIHDYLFQEKGLDTDLAINIQIKKIRECIEEMSSQGVEGANIQSLVHQQKQKIYKETYEEMSSLHCQPYLLSSFFHRIFYNVDDLFIFKKQFTTYHAVNSFFSYIFNQTDYFTLTSISFCKTSGRLSFGDSKLTDCLKPLNLLVRYQNDFETLEKQQDFKNPQYLPFRMTNNFVEFMGKIGVQGLFAGVLTACSMALTKEQSKMVPVLQIMFKDENIPQDRDDFIDKNVDYLIFKLKSLSQNKNVLHLAPQAPPGQASAQANSSTQSQSAFMQQESYGGRSEESKEGGSKYIELGQYKIPKEYLKFEMEKPNMFEEFNKKVFDLIEMSKDEKRLCLMKNNWNAWF